MIVYGRSDATASAPLENPVHPRELLATIYHSMGINPHQIMYNHLNQPRELVASPRPAPFRGQALFVDVDNHDALVEPARQCPA